MNAYRNCCFIHTERKSMFNGWVEQYYTLFMNHPICSLERCAYLLKRGSGPIVCTRQTSFYQLWSCSKWVPLTFRIMYMHGRIHRNKLLFSSLNSGGYLWSNRLLFNVWSTWNRKCSKHSMCWISCTLGVQIPYFGKSAAVGSSLDPHAWSGWPKSL